MMFESMEVGDYVVIRERPQRARVELADYARQTGKRFATCRLEGTLHLCVWRIDDDRTTEPTELEMTLMRSIKRYESRGDHKSARVIRRRLAKITAEASRTV